MGSIYPTTSDLKSFTYLPYPTLQFSEEWAIHNVSYGIFNITE